MTSNEVSVSTSIDQNILNHSGGLDESSLLQHFLDATNMPCGGSTDTICGPFFMDRTHMFNHNHNKEKDGLDHIRDDDATATFHDSSSEPISTSNNIDPFNRDMIGPRSCEYCGSSSTRICHSSDETVVVKDQQIGQDIPKCTRPKLYFMKKRPPFDNNADKWDPISEYSIQ